MPFLKCRKISFVEKKIESTIRNGWRDAIFNSYKQHINRYKGQWKNDKKEGFGVEIVGCKHIYEGRWLNGKRHGLGILKETIENGDPKIIYWGCWSEGKKQGYGVRWYRDSVYKGNFCKDKKHGFGSMRWHDGRYYEGMWQNNMLHGHGTLFNINGNQYTGDFANGKKEGKGVFYHIHTGQTQDGLWLSDTCTNSSLEDSNLRQWAITPTKYPIPQLEKFSCEQSK